jgi:hypothetical protein
MYYLVDHPFYLFVVALVLLLASAWCAGWVGKRRAERLGHSKDPFSSIEGATLGLLGLLLGFTFAMAVTRYDLRVQLVVDEANLIERVWLRTDTLPAPLNQQSRALLASYLQVRLEQRRAGLDPAAIDMAETRADQLQAQLWEVAVKAAALNRDVISNTYMSELNEMFDMQTRRSEARGNRIPVEAWLLLIFIAIVSTSLAGYEIGAETLGERGRRWMLNVLPLVLAAVLMLIADLDTPRSGLIRVDLHPLMELQKEIR